MSTDPFVAAVARAKEYEPQAKLLRQQRLAEWSEARTRAKAERAKERQAQKAIDFENRFLGIVIRKLVSDDLNSEYIQKITDYSHALLAQAHDPELPHINPYHAARIFRIFAYSLELASWRDVRIPDGFFYGQRLLAKLETAELMWSW